MTNGRSHLRDVRRTFEDVSSATATWVRARRAGTDRRWESDQAYHALWEERVALMVAPVRAGSTVIDVGAGRMAARGLLPPGCTYVPMDMVARDQSTVVCDLNRGPLPELTADWVLMSGVLEYVSDVPRLLAWARRAAPNVSLSFAVRDERFSYRKRLALGWVQHLDRDQLMALVRQAGFTVTDEREWEGQVLLVGAASEGTSGRPG